MKFKYPQINRFLTQCSSYLFVVICLSAFAIADNQRPNIIFLLTDDQRADTIGAMGNSIIHTPEIDTLAEQGVMFKNTFVTTSICMTNRACIFTGQYAARHRIWDFNTPFTEEQLADTYLGQLKAAGYRTGFIGKWGVEHPKQADGILDFNKGFPGQSRFFEGDVALKQGQHLTAKMGDQAIEFLEGSDADTPFHLSISFKAAHVQDSRDILSDQFPYDPVFGHLYEDITIPVPHTAAFEYYERQPDFIKESMSRDRWAIRFRSPGNFQKSVKGYYRLISGVDHVVGRIREQLEKEGLAENTIIIFSSDNGFFLGEYGFAGKWTPHEASIRVPLVVYDPRLNSSEKGKVRNEMTLSIDIAPTILSLAGITPPSGMQGVDLKPLLNSSDEPESWRNDFFYEHWFAAGGRIVPSEGYRDQRWKYMRYLEPEAVEAGVARHEELYDLATDPHETVNLAAKPAYAAQLAYVREQWAMWRKKAQ